MNIDRQSAAPSPAQSKRGRASRERAATDPAILALATVRKRFAAFNDALKVQGRLEQEFPKDLRKSEINYWERKIVKTDATEWIANVREVHRKCEKFQEALWDAINTPPTSAAGALALLNLLVEDMGFKHMALEQEEMSALVESVSSFLRAHLADEQAKGTGRRPSAPSAANHQIAA